jgi:sensor histidine kinase regulating citrate/malate metabolism
VFIIIIIIIIISSSSSSISSSTTTFQLDPVSCMIKLQPKNTMFRGFHSGVIVWQAM